MTAATAAAGAARAASARGATAIETLVALPVLMLVALGAVQFALLYHAKHALNHALVEAARAGSVAHADPQAVRAGLARGLVPWLYGAADLAEYTLNLSRAGAAVAEGEARGWIVLEQVSPTSAAFDDWAEPARDANGEPIAGLREIPNDGLVHRAMRDRPASGVGGWRDPGEPIGVASGQTLADANLLRLRLDYGVPLSVPVIGRLLAWALRTWHGCSPATARTLGVVDLGRAEVASRGSPLACRMLAAGGAAPAGRPRLPLRVTATLRMQSPARHAGAPAQSAAGPTAQGGAEDRPADDPVGGPLEPYRIPGDAGASPSPGEPAPREGPAADPAPVAASAPAGDPSAGAGRSAIRAPGRSDAPDPAFCRTPGA